MPLSFYPMNMKNPAQSILQYSMYPLEPIVALEIKKMYQARLKVASTNLSPHTTDFQTSQMTTKNENWDEGWFNNYE